MIRPRNVTRTVLAGILATGMLLVGCATGDPEATVDGDAAAAADADGDSIDEAMEPEVTEWIDSATAEEAASEAGLESGFVVPDEIKVGELTFAAPSFSHVDGIARATYETPACMVDVRKGVGPAGTVVADDGTGYMGESFPWCWETTAGDLVVTCYGNEEGKVLFAQWYDKVDPTVDGEDDAYSVRILGLGGEDVPMTDEEVGILAMGAVR